MKKQYFILSLFLTTGLVACGGGNGSGSGSGDGGQGDGGGGSQIKLPYTVDESKNKLLQLGKTSGFEISFNGNGEDTHSGQSGSTSQTVGFKNNTMWVKNTSAYKKVDNSLESYTYDASTQKYEYQATAVESERISLDYFLSSFTSAFYVAYNIVGNVQYGGMLTAVKDTTFLNRNAKEYTYGYQVASAKAELKLIIDTETGITLKIQGEASDAQGSAFGQFEVTSFVIGDAVSMPALNKADGGEGQGGEGQGGGQQGGGGSGEGQGGQGGQGEGGSGESGEQGGEGQGDEPAPIDQDLSGDAEADINKATVLSNIENINSFSATADIEYRTSVTNVVNLNGSQTVTYDTKTRFSNKSIIKVQGKDYATCSFMDQDVQYVLSQYLSMMGITLDQLKAGQGVPPGQSVKSIDEENDAVIFHENVIDDGQDYNYYKYDAQNQQYIVYEMDKSADQYYARYYSHSLEDEVQGTQFIFNLTKVVLNHGMYDVNKGGYYLEVTPDILATLVDKDAKDMNSMVLSVSKGIFVSIKNNYPYRASVELNKEAFSQMIGRTSLDYAKYIMSFDGVNNTTITFPNVEPKVCEHHLLEDCYVDNDQGHRKYCYQCGLFLGAVEAHNDNNDFGICVKCGHHKNEQRVKLDKYYLEADRAYAITYLQNGDKKLEPSIFATDSYYSSNDDQYGYVDITDLSKGQFRYFANSQSKLLIVTIDQGQPGKVQEGSCYNYQKQLVKIYAGVENIARDASSGGQAWTGGNNQPLEHYLDSLTPLGVEEVYQINIQHGKSEEKTIVYDACHSQRYMECANCGAIPSAYLSVEHSNPKVTYEEISGCKMKEITTCGACHEVIQTRDIYNHEYQYTLLSDTEVREILNNLDSYASMYSKQFRNPAGLKTVCSKCHEEEYLITEKDEIGYHTHGIGGLRLYKEGDKYTGGYDYAEIPHIFNDNHQCILCGVTGLHAGDYYMPILKNSYDSPNVYVSKNDNSLRYGEPAFDEENYIITINYKDDEDATVATSKLYFDKTTRYINKMELYVGNESDSMDITESEFQLPEDLINGGEGGQGQGGEQGGEPGEYDPPVMQGVYVLDSIAHEDSFENLNAYQNAMVSFSSNNNRAAYYEYSYDDGAFLIYYGEVVLTENGFKIVADSIMSCTAGGEIQNKKLDRTTDIYFIRIDEYHFKTIATEGKYVYFADITYRPGGDDEATLLYTFVLDPNHEGTGEYVKNYEGARLELYSDGTAKFFEHDKSNGGVLCWWGTYSIGEANITFDITMYNGKDETIDGIEGKPFEGFDVSGQFVFLVVDEENFVLKIELQGDDYYLVPKAEGGNDNPGGEDNPGDEPSLVDTSAFAGVYIEDLSQYGSSGRLDPDNREGGRLIINDDGTARLYYYDAEGEYEYNDGLIVEGDAGNFTFYDANGAYVATENGEEYPGETGNDITYIFSLSQEGIYKLQIFEDGTEYLYFYTLQDIYEPQAEEEFGIPEYLEGYYTALVPDEYQSTLGESVDLTMSSDGYASIQLNGEETLAYIGMVKMTGDNEITFSDPEDDVVVIFTIEADNTLSAEIEECELSFSMAEPEKEYDVSEFYGNYTAEVPADLQSDYGERMQLFLSENRCQLSYTSSEYRVVLYGNCFIEENQLVIAIDSIQTASINNPRDVVNEKEDMVLYFDITENGLENTNYLDELITFIRNN